MKIKYDPVADAAYIHFKDEFVKSDKTYGDWPFHVDVSEDGEVIGIEVMDASTVLSPSYLEKTEI